MSLPRKKASPAPLLRRTEVHHQGVRRLIAATGTRALPTLAALLACGALGCERAEQVRPEPAAAVVDHAPAPTIAEPPPAPTTTVPTPGMAALEAVPPKPHIEPTHESVATDGSVAPVHAKPPPSLPVKSPPAKPKKLQGAAAPVGPTGGHVF
jgi:hypothetical protein